MRNCRRDGGGPPGVGLQKQASNPLKLRWLRARVVSVREKAQSNCQVWVKKMSASEPLMTYRKNRDDVKTGGAWLPQDKPKGSLLIAWVASGI